MVRPPRVGASPTARRAPSRWDGGARWPSVRKALRPSGAMAIVAARWSTRATTVVVTDTTYYYDDGTYYARAMSNGEVVYQVVAPPPGATIATLPAGCQS